MIDSLTVAMIVRPVSRLSHSESVGSGGLQQSVVRSVSRLPPLAITLAAVPTVMITARAKRALLALIIRLTHSIIWRPLRRIVVGIRQGTHWLLCRRVQQHLQLQLLRVGRARVWTVAALASRAVLVASLFAVAHRIFELRYLVPEYTRVPTSTATKPKQQ